MPQLSVDDADSADGDSDGEPVVPPLAPDLERFRLHSASSQRWWRWVLSDGFGPPGSPQFANPMLRSDGLVLEHVVGFSLPPIELPPRAVSFSFLPAPRCSLGTEPNLALSATGQVQAPPHAADAAGWLSAELSSFPADRVTQDPNPMFLGAPVYGGPDGPLDGCRISPDRRAPVARGSLIRRAGILPDDEFLDAALVSHRRVDRYPRVSTSHFVQTVAAFGAGLLPPSRGQFLLGAWPPLSASRLPFAITVKVVGVRSPRTGFVRGSLVSGRVLFQRRAPVLLPFLPH